jgi:hypothetical protein
MQNFSIAAKGYGKYCPVKNELRVRRGRKVYRYTCGESELRISTAARPEVALLIAPDATVSELRNAFTSVIDWYQNH